MALHYQTSQFLLFVFLLNHKLSVSRCFTAVIVLVRINDVSDGVTVIDYSS
jgi:hypothetical protein